MSTMKQTDKKRGPVNNQTKRPARVESRETKLQQEKANTTPRAKEANKKALSARANSNIAVRDRNKNTRPSKVQENIVVHTEKVSKYTHNKPSIHLDTEVTEPNDVRDESDSETVTDSVSSSGDSRATEDQKLEYASIVSPRSIRMDSSELDLHSIQINVSSDISKNSKDLKVHQKPPSTPSSISSEECDFQDPVEQKETVFLDEASNGVLSDDETLHENVEDEVKQALDLKIAQMEMRIEKLEDELREVAALEISLYTVVQEHGSSTHKVHTPAHRLSRLYIHASKHYSESKRAAVAGNIVSGLAMISTSCGNDVSRLTFWWSNIIVLREIINQTLGSLNQLTSPVSNQSDKPDFTEFVDKSRETRFLTSEIEKLESEIFSRIVESIWCQTLMPNMLKNETTRKLLGPISGDQQQCDFSINLWLNAFQDAFKRICPARAGGLECGCIPILSKMVMEQCIGRLDVAMFNCILRESAHEMKTESVSDPITESRVLPIPAEHLSFGSGAQLKKAVGNWSKFLADTFSVDNNAVHTTNEHDASNCEEKWFNFLNSLSHLLMVPKDMLMDRSIRAEVCPSISLPLLKRILSNFTPDEFCPDPVPNTVLEALNAESIIESRSSEESSCSFPYAAATIIYKPPSSIDVSKKVSETGGNIEISKLSMNQRKGYTRDEELDELNSSSRFFNKKLPLVNGNTTRNARYELLHEVWSS